MERVRWWEFGDNTCQRKNEIQKLERHSFEFYSARARMLEILESVKTTGQDTSLVEECIAILEDSYISKT